MSPIIRPEGWTYPFTTSETKINVILDKTHEVVLAILQVAKTYLSQEQLVEIKKSNVNKNRQGCGKGSKRNKLRIPYKDRRSENIVWIPDKGSFLNNNKGEPLFLKREWPR